MSDDKEFIVRWEAADGYVGKSRPQYTHITADSVKDAGSVEAAMELMWDCVQEDFNQMVTPETENDEDFKDWAESILAAGDDEDSP